MNHIEWSWIQQKRSGKREVRKAPMFGEEQRNVGYPHAQDSWHIKFLPFKLFPGEWVEVYMSPKLTYQISYFGTISILVINRRCSWLVG